MAESVQADEGTIRRRAAAWAWYERSAGSIAPALGKSKVFSVRCNFKHKPSRFALEADVGRRLLHQLRQDAHHFVEELKFEHTDDAESDIQRQEEEEEGQECLQSPEPFNNLIGPLMTSPLSQQVAIESDFASVSSTQDCVILDMLDCWDCGSSLFDSFELVAMSEKVHTNLDESHIRSLHLDYPLSANNGHSLTDLEQGISNDEHDLRSSMSPSSSGPSAGSGLRLDALPLMERSPSYRTSKQGVYEMLLESVKYSKKTTWPHQLGPDPTKLKNRISFCFLARAVKQLTNLGHHHGFKHTHGHKHQDDGNGNRKHHHHHHYLPHFHHIIRGGEMQMQYIGNRQHQSHHKLHRDRHVHHNYHYLFHSDDANSCLDLPLPKPQIMAAAGLKTLRQSNHDLSAVPPCSSASPVYDLNSSADQVW